MENSKFNIQNSKMWRSLLSFGVVCCFMASFAVTSVAQNKPAEKQEMPGGYPKISGAISTDSIGIGDRFFYTIDVEKDIAQGIYFPIIGGEQSHYELIEEPRVDTLERDGRRLKIRQTYHLAAFQEGIHHIVPQVIYADKNITDTLSGDDTMHLMVTTFIIDSTAHSIFDIKPQKDMPFKFAEISGYVTWSVVALLVLALLAYVAYRIMRHYGKSFADIFRPTPPLPPHEVARQALEKLYVQRLWQADKHKLYYSTITDILRTYIDGRFGVGAMEMTSDEIIEAMRGVELPQKSAMDLTQILRDADLVKFAKALPEAEQNEATYSAAWDFVEQTKPVEEVEDDEDEAQPKKKKK